MNDYNFNNIENVLIHQKDTLLQLVNDWKFEQALELLDFVKELWTVTEYSYKWDEIRKRIVDELNKQINSDIHWKHRAEYRRILESM